ncbi:hypothetical protein Mapa_012530 [Marchantia paleacea]|nr:hypothetical protein Mapa_012530 [Marchantia paleacea]
MHQSKWADSWVYNYFSNVLRGRALFQSDDALKRSSAGLKVVQTMNRVGSPFDREFGNSMIKMGRADILTGTQGQIRKKCNFVNR